MQTRWMMIGVQQTDMEKNASAVVGRYLAALQTLHCVVTMHHQQVARIRGDDKIWGERGVGSVTTSGETY